VRSDESEPATGSVPLDSTASADPAAATTDAAAPRRFAALRERGSRGYLITSGLSMMGDNVEHVITYWVLWQTFHSPTLTGFQIVSHWLPFLVLSVPFGSLAERYDCRKLIQIAQALFMLVSVSWGVLFLTGTLQIWHACVLLVLHGIAGALWGPAEQLLLHDFVGREELPSAIRLNATFRNLGILFGPVVGSALLVGVGPEAGILLNVLLYLPMTLVLFRVRATGHLRDDGAVARRITFRDTVRVLRSIASNRVIVVMMIVAGLTALTVGGAIQPAMPIFADRLGAGSGDLGYGLLLFANGAGGVLGGFLLEATGWLRPNARTAVWTTVLFGVCTLVFSLTPLFAVAAVALVVGGVANIASASAAQSVVQLEAPAGERGRVVGAFSVFANGMRTFEGLLLGGVGALIGTPATVAWAAAALILGTLAAAAVWRPRARRLA
jgi:MFS family permease